MLHETILSKYGYNEKTVLNLIICGCLPLTTFSQSSETTFVELPVMSESEKSEKQESKNLPVARIHTDDNLSIDIFCSISADQIQSLIGAVTNVK